MNNEADRWTLIRHGHELEVVDNTTKSIVCIAESPILEWCEASLQDMVAHANRAYALAAKEKRENTERTGS